MSKGINHHRYEFYVSPFKPLVIFFVFFVICIKVCRTREIFIEWLEGACDSNVQSCRFPTKKTWEKNICWSLATDITIKILFQLRGQGCIGGEGINGISDPVVSGDVV